MHVPYVHLAVTDDALKEALLRAAERVMRHGQFILGPEVESFENEFAKLCGTKFAVGTDNCTSALTLVMRGLGIGNGDEVITVPNSFLASASSIVLAGARPVFVDVGEDSNMDPDALRDAITPRTKAILPVHWTGRMADMDAILAVADAHDIPVIEDAAQAVGARYKERSAGSIGRAGCFSFHPLKNLGACGDAGIVVTDDEELASFLRLARNHGLRDRDTCEFWSPNCRLDALHAAMLSAKLPFLDGWNDARRANAAFYRERLGDIVRVPDDPAHLRNVYHTFIIQCEERDALKEFLHQRGIETAVHYPIPIHLQHAAVDLGYRKGDFPVAEAQAERILSLPVHPGLRSEQREAVVEGIRSFVAR